MRRPSRRGAASDPRASVEVCITFRFSAYPIYAPTPLRRTRPTCRNLIVNFEISFREGFAQRSPHSVGVPSGIARHGVDPETRCEWEREKRVESPSAGHAQCPAELLTVHDPGDDVRHGKYISEWNARTDALAPRGPHAGAPDAHGQPGDAWHGGEARAGRRRVPCAGASQTPRRCCCHPRRASPRSSRPCRGLERGREVFIAAEDVLPRGASPAADAGLQLLAGHGSIRVARGCPRGFQRPAGPRASGFERRGNRRDGRRGVSIGKCARGDAALRRLPAPLPRRVRRVPPRRYVRQVRQARVGRPRARAALPGGRGRAHRRRGDGGLWPAALGQPGADKRPGGTPPAHARAQPIQAPDNYREGRHFASDRRPTAFGA